MNNQLSIVGMMVLVKGAEAERIQTLVKMSLEQFVRDHQSEVLQELGGAYVNNQTVIEANEFFVPSHGLTQPLVIRSELQVLNAQSHTRTHTHAHTRHTC